MSVIETIVSVNKILRPSIFFLFGSGPLPLPSCQQTPAYTSLASPCKSRIPSVKKLLESNYCKTTSLKMQLFLCEFDFLFLSLVQRLDFTVVLPKLFDVLVNELRGLEASFHPTESYSICHGEHVLFPVRCYLSCLFPNTLWHI